MTHELIASDETHRSNRPGIHGVTQLDAYTLNILFVLSCRGQTLLAGKALGKISRETPRTPIVNTSHDFQIKLSYPNLRDL